ncbi:hypothetical protein LCGC14_1320820, partial [marine sediment metagenome]
YYYILLADFDKPTPDIFIGNGAQNFQNDLIANPMTLINFFSNELAQPVDLYYDWTDSLNSYDSSYMSHTYYPDDYLSTWSMNTLNMYNQFPTKLLTENMISWFINYDSAYTTSSHIDGQFISWLNSGINSKTPDTILINSGSLISAGDLNSVGGTNSTYLSTEPITNTNYYNNIDVPSQIDWDNPLNMGSWGTYNENNLKYDDSQYSTIVSDSVPIYNDATDIPLLGEFFGTGVLNYQDNLGTIGTPYTTVGGVYNPIFTGDQRMAPDQWLNWDFSGLYGSGGSTGNLVSDGSANTIYAGITGTGQGTQGSQGAEFPDVASPVYDNFYSTPIDASDFSGTGILNYQGNLGTIGAPYTTLSGVNNPQTSGPQKVGPNEWGDWTFTEGSGSTDYGTLTTNDGDSNRIDAGTVSQSPYYTDGILRPSSTSTNWWFSGDHTDVNDNVVEPSSGDQWHLLAAGEDDEDNSVIRMGFPNTITSSSITNIAVKTLGYYEGSTAGPPEVTVYMGGGWRPEQICNIPENSEGWTTDNFAGSWDQADLDGLQIQYRQNVPDGDDLNWIEVVYVVVTYLISPPTLYKHEYLIKWDLPAGATGPTIQSLIYDWKQTAARNTKMYTTSDGVNYDVLVADLTFFGTAFYFNSFPGIGSYVQNGDEVWIKIVSDEGGDFDVRFDQLYIEYTTSTPNYEMSKEVEWSAPSIYMVTDWTVPDGDFYNGDLNDNNGNNNNIMYDDIDEGSTPDGNTIHADGPLGEYIFKASTPTFDAVDARVTNIQLRMYARDLMWEGWAFSAYNDTYTVGSNFIELSNVYLYTNDWEWATFNIDLTGDVYNQYDAENFDFWLRADLDGGYLDVDTIQIRFNYTSVPIPISMDTLTYAHSGTSVTFEIYDYTGVGGWWDTAGSSSFPLSPEHIGGNGDTIKVRYSKTSSSNFTLNIDQLRIDYKDGWGVSPGGGTFENAVAAIDSDYIESYTDLGSGEDSIDFSLADWTTIPANYYITEIGITTTALYEGPAPTLNVYYQIEGGWSTGKTQSMTTSYTTNTLSWTGLWNNPGYGDADADGINIRFETVGGSGSSVTKIDQVYVTIYIAPEVNNYKHEYYIKWDVDDVSMSSIQNLWYEWKQTAAMNTIMYIFNGIDYLTEVSDLGTSTSYQTGSFALTSQYIQTGDADDEVWLYIVSDEGGDFDVRFDQLYIEYTKSTPNYEMSMEVEWSAPAPTSMNELTYTLGGDPVTFEIYDYTGVGGYWDTISGGGPFTLSSEHVFGDDTIKVRFSKTSSNPFTLDIDQLRIDYTYLDHYDHWINATAEWSIPSSGLYSIDSLDFDHQVTLGSVTFEVWDWLENGGQFETKTGTILDLSISPEYIGPGNSVKINYLSSTETSSTTLSIDVLRVNYTTSELIYVTPAMLDLNSTFHLDSVTAEDTIEPLQLTYAYKTDGSQLVELNIWNYNTLQWDLVDENVYNSFTPVHYYQIGSDYYNSNFDIVFKLNGTEVYNSFNFYLDQFLVNYSWTRTSGSLNADVSKTITDPLLNRYDGFSNYQKLYNVTIEFDYTFTKNNSLYADFAKFYINYGASQDSFNLIKDGNQHSFSYT